MLRMVLDMCRTATPTDEAWGWFEHNVLRTQKAWQPHDWPTVSDMRHILNMRPHTVLLACTRYGQSILNDLAVQALFPRRVPLATVDGDVESNPLNYDENHKMFKDRAKLKPLPVPIHMGMQLYLTKNVIKETDFVNGMQCTVTGFDEEPRPAVRVTTRTGIPLTIWRWTDRNRGNISYYPLRPGYASTILKFQGA